MGLYNIIHPEKLVDGVREDPSVILANFEAIQEILNAGGAEFLLNTGVLDTRVTADVTTNVVCNGGFANLAVAKAAPPAWLDTTGHIILPGMYLVGAAINIVNSPTTPGLYSQWSSPFTQQLPIPLDFLNWFQLVVSDFFTLLSTDLPYGTTATISTQTDATGEFSVEPFAARMASGG